MVVYRVYCSGQAARHPVLASNRIFIQGGTFLPPRGASEWSSYTLQLFSSCALKLSVLCSWSEAKLGGGVYCESERRSSLSSSWLVINLPPLPTTPGLHSSPAMSWSWWGVDDVDVDDVCVDDAGGGDVDVDGGHHVDLDDDGWSVVINLPSLPISHLWLMLWPSPVIMKGLNIRGWWKWVEGDDNPYSAPITAKLSVKLLERFQKGKIL